MKDWRGNEISVGSTVIYVGRQSSSVRLTQATVKEIGTTPSYGRPMPCLRVVRAKDGKQVVLTALEWVTVIEGKDNE